MDEKKPGGLINNWPSIALITALAANLLWLQAPLKSSRPAERAAFNGTALGDQDAEARLWQDPFEAITKDQQRESSNKGYPSRHMITEVKQQIAHHTERDVPGKISQEYPPPKQITIMLVMVTGSPYAEGAEWRIRGRFAVLAGLSRSGYKPSDPEHVGYFRMGWPRGETLKQHSVEEARECLIDDPDENCLGLTVPFEWFQVNDFSVSPSQRSYLDLNAIRKRNPIDRADEVLLFWIKDDMFEDFPLKRLALFKQTLADNIEIEENRQTDIKFKIIGPWSSTTLQAMLTLDAESSGPSKWSDFVNQALAGVEIYSPSATAVDSLLLDTHPQPTCDDATKDPRSVVQKILLEKKKIQFHNVTLTDDVLICALIDELKLRGVNPDQDAIALVSEWDTFYGRALPHTFSQLLNRNDVVHVSYLRGLDGKLAGSESPSSKTTDDSGKEQAAIKRREIAPLERPEGNSQLDYIPRLAAKLKAGESNSGKKITAIGVLGSDVYDKLLLLQSLRIHFPNVIFFTTDLDARLFHSGELNWSRNLIVASSFGLQLEKELQGEIPPFRDSYQTATFLASQLALSTNTSKEVSKISAELNTSITPLLPVQLFEIGRAGAYPLSPGQTTKSVHPLNPHILKDLWGTHLAKVLLLVVGFVVLVLPLVGYFSETARELGKITRETFRRNTKQQLWFRALLWFLMLLPLILALVVYRAHFSGQDEPFSLIDGISIWPAEVIRLVAAYLSLYFLFLTWSELRDNEHKLSAKYFVFAKTSENEIEALTQKRGASESSPPEQPSQGGVWRTLKLELRRWAPARPISINRWDAQKSILTDEGEEKVDALQLWEDYNWRGSFWHRVARFFPLLLVYFLSILMLTMLLGRNLPFVPYRGQISYWTNQFVLYFAVLTLIFLIFFVVDAAQLCKKFIDNLRHRTTKWPSDTYRKFEKDYGIHKDYLDEWIDVHLIGERTKVVSKLIFYPFIVLFLTIASRYEFFDRWDWPILLILVFGLNSAYALYAVWLIRRSAEQVRQEAIVKLKQKLLKVLGGERKLPAGENREDKENAKEPDKDPKNSNLPEQIRLLIQGVESFEEGAFVPLSKHPVIGALAIPFGGAGILAVLDYLTSM